ncbi:MAG: SUMF1/EgtB/PvdO family nonheme iron enzyme [Bacteroidaceae bacterium]|nr:SUMF1/EgtB/PvdO family nonheme iron enzyme [Bacteroidaceae bacterium]
MKKDILLAIALFAIASQGVAQKFIDVYQNGSIAGSMFSADLDSINITGASNARKLNFWSGGRLANSFNVSSVDSVKVFRSEEEPLVYLGILGFNQELYPKAIDILASSTSSLYTSFVNSLSRKSGTLLYYSVDQALDILTSYNFTTPLSSVNLITFTDGLDQGSLMTTSKYQTDDAYLKALGRRITSTKVRGLPLTAYSLGLRGNDVSDYTQFQSNLRQLATATDKAIEVSSMSDVQSRLQEIADHIISISNRQTISMKIPGTSNGTRIRFTFDGNSPEYSTMYIEGTFNLSDRTLRNVTYHGIRATSGTVARGEQEGIFVTYTFTGLQRTDGNGLIPTNYIRQYNQSPGSSTWQNNSEFSPSNNTKTTITHSGAAIMLVLDCSSSLGSQFSNMQSYARDFISRVANNAASFNLSTPQNIKAELGLGSDGFVVDVSWDAVKYAESYKIYRNGYQAAENITATHWQDNSPERGTNYYTVYAVGHGLTTSNRSEAVKLELSAPTNVSASMDENVWGVNVSWDAVKYAESYTIYRNGSKIAEGITSSNWRDESPAKGSYYYVIYAIGHGLTSTASSRSETVNCELSAPTNVSASMDENVWGVNVSWDVVKYAESYTIYRNGSKIAEGITSSNWRDESPVKGSNYYTIAAVGHGLTSSTSSRSETVNCELSAPTNVSASMDDNEWGVNVSWDAVKYAESYTIYRNGSKKAEGITSSNWRDESPAKGSNYYVIYAIGHGLTSTASSRSYVDCKLAKPQNVEASLTADGKSIHISWDSVKFAEFYRVYRKDIHSYYGTGNYGVLVADSVRELYCIDTPNYYESFCYIAVAAGHGFESSPSEKSNFVKNYTFEIQNDDNKIIYEINGVKFTMVKVNYEGKDFYMAETEVTQKLCRAIGYHNPSYKTDSDLLPVESVELYYCEGFIDKLNDLTGQNFRLPSRDEWKNVAGFSVKYPNTLGDPNSNTVIHEVASGSPNSWGLYDMEGNVYEWVDSEYDFGGATYYYVMGSHNVPCILLPQVASRVVGFRLALTVPE